MTCTASKTCWCHNPHAWQNCTTARKWLNKNGFSKRLFDFTFRRASYNKHPCCDKKSICSLIYGNTNKGW